MKKFDHSSGHMFHHEGVSLYYEILPNIGKPTLLLLHGGFGSIGDFNPIIPDLADDYQIIGIDSRGHGRSTFDAQAFSYERAQNDIERLFEYLNINKLSIIGYSDGGILGYRLAAESNLMIENLITIGAPWCNADIAASQNLLKELDLQCWKEMMPAAYATFERYQGAKDPAEFLDKVKAMWSDESTTGYPNDKVRIIKCPTLIIRGDADELFPRQSAAQLADSIENSKLLNLPFAGHAVFDEQRDIFISVLKQFLNI